ncbi:hypothetical protein D3C84_709910 [compost metagenome]
MTGQPGPARQKQQPAGGDRQTDTDQRLRAEVGEIGDTEVTEDQQGEAGGEQGEAPAQQQGQAGEAEKMDLQPLMQAGSQGPERHQGDGTAQAEVLIEGVVMQGAQQGAPQAEDEQHQPEQEGGDLSFSHGIFLGI